MIKCMECNFIGKDIWTFYYDYVYDEKEKDEVIYLKCPKCGAKTELARPPKFSLEDKYAHLRREAKKEAAIIISSPNLETQHKLKDLGKLAAKDTAELYTLNAHENKLFSSGAYLKKMYGAKLQEVVVF